MKHVQRAKRRFTQHSHALWIYLAPTQAVLHTGRQEIVVLLSTVLPR